MPTLRFATPDDVPFLWEMLVLAASMEGTPDDVARAKVDPDLAVYVDGYGRPGDRGFVAIEGDRPIGAAWGRLLVGEAKPAKVWTADTPELAIATVTAARGRGVGSLLLRAFLDDAKAHFPGVALSVREGSPAVRLYERHGFVVERTVTNRVGGVSIVMRCALPASGAPR